jgi:hypothetical protein
MVKGTSTPMRVAADVATSAARVAPAEHRTATEQVNYWARIGMQVERATSLEGRRLRAVIAGEAPFSSLATEERIAVHATMDARIAERVAQQRFGAAARKAGQVAVSIDDDGTLVEIAADGTHRRL